MNSPVRLWRQFWLGGDDAFKNLIFADAEGIQAIGTARKETMQHRHGEFDSNLNLSRLSGTIYVASGGWGSQTMGNRPRGQRPFAARAFNSGRKASKNKTL